MLRLQTVLCAFDFSDASRQALVDAADLAERSHAALHLLHVNPLFRARLAHAGPDPDGGFRQQARTFVDDVLGADHAFEVLAPVVHESHGETPAGGIRRYADAIEADVVVMGTHGRRGLEQLFIGSVAAETLRQSGVPVLVVPERAERTAPGPDAPVLVGVDFSDHTAPALDLARSFGEAYGAPIALAHVRDVPPDTVLSAPYRPHPTPEPYRSWEAAHEALEALLTDAERADEAVGRFAPHGQPAPGLVEIATRETAGLVVVGTHGRTGWDRVRLGSVAEAVVRDAPCPVLVVPTPSAPPHAVTVTDRASAPAS